MIAEQSLLKILTAAKKILYSIKIMYFYFPFGMSIQESPLFDDVKPLVPYFNHLLVFPLKSSNPHSVDIMMRKLN